MISLQGFDGDGCFGFGVSDGMTFVQDQIIPMIGLEKFQVTSNNFIWGYDGQIALLKWVYFLIIFLYFQNNFSVGKNTDKRKLLKSLF